MGRCIREADKNSWNIIATNEFRYAEGIPVL